MQMTVSLERELMPNLAGKVSFLYFRDKDLYETVNALRPYGVHGSDSAGRSRARWCAGNRRRWRHVIVYDYPAAVRGSAFVGNIRVNRTSDQDDYTRVVEFVLARRTIGHWGLQASGNVLFNHRWNNGIAPSPNQDYFNLNHSREWQAKVSGNYDLPKRNYRVGGGGALERRPDAAHQHLPKYSVAKHRHHPHGGFQRRRSPRSSFNARLGKFIELSRTRIGLSLDIFNLLNTSTAAPSVSRPDRPMGR